MDLVSKKNGTITRFHQLISAIASKIGFTPPTGMSATNVQDAIEEVNTRVTAIGVQTGVDISDRTASNLYTCPSDGYLLVRCTSASGFIGANVYVNGYYRFFTSVSGNNNTDVIFIKKGMQLCKLDTSSSTGTLLFYPIN